VEKNAGHSQSPDLPEFMLPNLKPVMTNYKLNFGETTTLTLKLKNGKKKIPPNQENL